MMRRLLASVLAGFCGFAACKHEPEPAYPQSAGPTGPVYPPPGPTPAPSPAPAPTPAPAPVPAPTSPAPAPVVGLPCAHDDDLVCAFGHCLNGRCGGCRNDGDCKSGAACANTPLGLACVPSSSSPAPAPAPAPSATAPAPPAPAPTPTAPAPSTHAKARERCLQKTNDYRATKGLPPVTARTDRDACTDGQAQSDATQGEPHGAYGQCGELAQNECPGWKGTPESIVDSCLAAMFAEGPGTGPSHGHYSNLMNPSYTSLSCGFFVAADGSVWMTQDFFK